MNINELILRLEAIRKEQGNVELHSEIWPEKLLRVHLDPALRGLWDRVAEGPVAGQPSVPKLEEAQ